MAELEALLETHPSPGAVIQIMQDPEMQIIGRQFVFIYF